MMTEKRDKVNVEDIIGLIKTDEPTDSVEEVRKLRGRETEKRFTLTDDVGMLDVACGNIYDDGDFIGTVQLCDGDKFVELLNELHEENMNLRAKNTKFVIILKDVVNDLKRMNTYRYAEHLEKIANLHFLSEKELKE